MRMPLKKIALLLAALGLTAAACAQKLKGSDTLLPLAQKAAENYSEKNPSYSVHMPLLCCGVSLCSGARSGINESERKLYEYRCRQIGDD